MRYFIIYLESLDVAIFVEREKWGDEVLFNWLILWGFLIFLFFMLVFDLFYFYFIKIEFFFWKF